MTKASSRLQIDDRAAATINAYPPAEQRRIRSAIGHLLGRDVMERLGTRVRHLPAEEPLYIFRVPPDFRIIFSRELSREGDLITVLDVLRQGTIDGLAASASAATSTVEPAEEPRHESTSRPKAERHGSQSRSSHGARRRARGIGHGV